MRGAGLRELTLRHDSLVPYQELMNQIASLSSLAVLDMGKAPKKQKQLLLVLYAILCTMVTPHDILNGEKTPTCPTPSCIKLEYAMHQQE